MSYRARLAALWTVGALAFGSGTVIAMLSGVPATATPGTGVAVACGTTLIRMRMRRLNRLDHLEWHRQEGTHCPNEDAPPWGTPLR